MGQHLHDTYVNRRTQKTLIVHLARDISQQKKREDAFRKMIAISHEVAALGSMTNGAAPVTPLSSQELEILRMFAAGNDAPRIAKALGISPQTLRNHLHTSTKNCGPTTASKPSPTPSSAA